MALSKEFQDLIRSSKNKYSTSGGEAVKFKEGKTQFRILPSKDGAKFWQDVGTHWIKTEKNGKPVAVVGCFDTVYDKPCPICTAIEKAAKAATDDQTLELIKEWKAVERVLVNALIRTGSDASESPVILEMTKTTFGNILSQMEEYSETHGNLVDIDVTFDFIVERSGKGLDTKYTVMPAAKPKPVDPKVMDQLHDLLGYVEKNFFKGDENKALMHIANMTGISTGAILLSARKAGILTGLSAVVDEAPTTIDEVPVAVAPAAKPQTALTPAKGTVETTGVSDDELEALMAELGT